MKMTPETILQSRITAALMALLCLLPGFIGCGGDDSPAAPSSTPVILCPGDTIAAYGRVNDWPWISADLLHEEICALADNGWRGYLIEMGGSARLGKVSEEAAKSAIGERYPLLVQWCAEEGLTILNSVQNDNAGQGKFGDRSPPLSGQVGFSAWLVGLIASVGRPDVVVVQPVAETQTPAGSDLERLCASVLTNFTLVNNFASRPETKPAWATYNATHPWSIESISEAEIIVGDTSPIIIETDADGNMSGPSSPEQATRFYLACSSAGALFSGLYIFSHDGPVDYATIESVGEVLP